VVTWGVNGPLLVNILGHAAGALIFAIFLRLLFSGRGWSGARGRNLSGLAAALALGWNLGSLIVLVWPGMPKTLLEGITGFCFSVLSLLPAVLLHISLRESQPYVVRAGYVLSAIAVAMHSSEAFVNAPALHQWALLLITAGFFVLTAAAVARLALDGAARRGLLGARIATSMCLALFAMSFLHFGVNHADQAWSGELVIHHAGIPLALFVLLQDYRFVLLDALVRFLANALLAAVVTWFVIEVAFRLALEGHIAPEPLQEALLLVSVCLTLVVFAWLRGCVQAWLTRAVFRQGSVAALAARLKDCPPFSNEEHYLDWAASVVAAAFRTKGFAVAGQDEIAAAASLRAPALLTLFPAFDPATRWSWMEVLAPIRLGEGRSKVLVLGGREGGQRYLGEDLEALAQACAEIAEKVEMLRQREMGRLVSQAELRALQSQINPHFLFNALNTLYGTIPQEAAAARRMVLNLAEVFRYFLQSDKTFVTLAKELEIVRAYLEVEQSRLGERLKVEIQVDDEVLQLPIPVLSIQPLVENAIKHGIAPRTEPGHLRIAAARIVDELRITVENSGGGSPASAGTGIGLQNVTRRLEICYGPSATLRFAPGEETTKVEISIPAVQPAPAR
jgi:two-component system, LytTR family, sensor kinase